MKRNILFCTGFIIGALTVLAFLLYEIDYRLQNPKLTNTELVINHWWVTIPIVAGCALMQITLKYHAKK